LRYLIFHNLFSPHRNIYYTPKPDPSATRADEPQRHRRARAPDLALHLRAGGVQVGHHRRAVVVGGLADRDGSPWTTAWTLIYRYVALRLAVWWRSSCSPWCWCGFSSSSRYLLKWCIACSRIFAPSILSSVPHIAGAECRAGPRRVLHWDDVGETQKRCSSGLRESPLDEKARDPPRGDTEIAIW